MDATFAEIAADTSEPAVGMIRLAWWREALEALDRKPSPAEPRLQAVAEHVLPLGVGGSAVAAIEDGYAALLAADVNVDRVGAGGARLFEAIAGLIGHDDSMLAPAGRLAMLARVRGLVPDDVAPAARSLMRQLQGHSFARPLRPLTLLARLAARDFLRTTPEPEATPARAVAMLSHRLSGRVTGGG